MANYNKLTETKYKAIKLLLKGGATVKEVMEYLQISEPVVYGVRNTENYAEYINARAERELKRKQIAAMKAKEAEKKEAKPEAKPEVKEVVQQMIEPKSVQITATHYMQEEMRKTNELLKLISNKLAFIVDELCGVQTNAEQNH